MYIQVRTCVHCIISLNKKKMQHTHWVVITNMSVLICNTCYFFSGLMTSTTNCSTDFTISTNLLSYVCVLCFLLEVYVSCIFLLEVFFTTFLCFLPTHYAESTEMKFICERFKFWVIVRIIFSLWKPV